MVFIVLLSVYYYVVNLIMFDMLVLVCEMLVVYNCFYFCVIDEEFKVRFKVEKEVWNK